MAHNNIYVAVYGGYPFIAFTSRKECIRWMGLEWPKPPTNLRVYKMRDGQRWAEDITARLYGLAEED